MLISSPI